MSLEVWSTVASIATFIAIAATGVAAIVQLQHLRASNQLTGLLDVLSRIEDPTFNDYADQVKNVVRERLPDPEYRRSIVDGSFVRSDNPWLNMANSYEWIGSLVKHRLVPEEPFMDVYSARLLIAWEIASPLVAIRRRASNDRSLWENFEYLAARAHQWEKQFPGGAYPKDTPRLDVPDLWLEEDRRLGISP